MSLSLIKKIVSANCSRRVGKEVYDEINALSNEFFNVSLWILLKVQSISDRLIDYCSLGERKTVNVSDVKLLMQRQRLITKYKTFEDLVRENLNKQQIDMLINVPEYEMQIEEVDDYLWFL